MPISTSKYFHDETTKMVAITVVLSYFGEGPTKDDYIAACDHLLSSLPGAGDTDGKEPSEKSTLLASLRQSNKEI